MSSPIKVLGETCHYCTCGFCFRSICSSFKGQTVSMSKVALYICPFWTLHFLIWTPPFGWTPRLYYTLPFAVTKKNTYFTVTLSRRQTSPRVTLPITSNRESAATRLPNFLANLQCCSTMSTETIYKNRVVQSPLSNSNNWCLRNIIILYCS